MPTGMTPSEIAKAAVDATQQAIDAGRFLIVAYRIETVNGKATLRQDFNAVDFPHGDYHEAVHMLRNRLSEELNKATREVKDASRGAVAAEAERASN